jgi:hypothetical protein
MSELRALLGRLEVSLEAIRTSSEFLRNSHNLRKQGAFLYTAQSNAFQKQLLTTFLGQKSFTSEETNRALYALTCATLEGFVRDLVKIAAKEVSATFTRYDDVPETFKIRNLILSGRTLSQVADHPDHWAIDYSKLVASLGNCVPGSQTVSIASEVFGLFVSQITPAKLQETLEWVGISIRWGDLAKHRRLKTLLPGLNTSKEVQEALALLIRNRNKIVHKGDGSPSISDLDLSNAIGLVDGLGAALVDQVEKDVVRRKFSF